MHQSLKFVYEYMIRRPSAFENIVVSLKYPRLVQYSVHNPHLHKFIVDYVWLIYIYVYYGKAFKFDHPNFH